VVRSEAQLATFNFECGVGKTFTLELAADTEIVRLQLHVQNGLLVDSRQKVGYGIALNKDLIGEARIRRRLIVRDAGPSDSGFDN
jgi:hypothetical protein